jgi:hypothetical protein
MFRERNVSFGLLRICAEHVRELNSRDEPFMERPLPADFVDLVVALFRADLRF